MKAVQHLTVHDETGALCLCGWGFDASALAPAIREEESKRRADAHVRWESNPRGPIFGGTVPSSDGWTGD